MYMLYNSSIYPSSVAFHTLAIAARHNNVSLLGVIRYCLHDLQIGNGGSSRQRFAKLFFSTYRVRCKYVTNRAVAGVGGQQSTG